MKALPIIHKRLGPFFKAHGFAKKGSVFYKIENNLAFCVLFEKPSDAVYTNFHIIPLYIPAEFHYLDYGKRLMNLPEYIQEITKIHTPTSEEEVYRLCERVQNILTDDIFCFFQQVSSPEKLLHYIDAPPPEYMYRLPRGGWFGVRLALYTSLFLHRYDRFYEELSRAKLILKEDSISLRPDLAKARYEELVTLTQITEQGSRTIDDYFSQVMDRTYEVCF